MNSKATRKSLAAGARVKSGLAQSPSFQLPLSSDECEILVLLSEAGSVEAVARLKLRDRSAVTRQLLRLSQKWPVVEKINRKWTLTPLGESVVDSIRHFGRVQSELLSREDWIAIGTNQEFSARVLAPDLQGLQKCFPGVRIRCATYGSGIEAPLLRREIELGLECGRPTDPTIRYRQLLEEPLVVVCSPAFAKSHGFHSKMRPEAFQSKPHIFYERLPPARYLGVAAPAVLIARFNDIASVRAACVVGAGWALLPRYAVKTELENGSLLELHEAPIKESYGVWWLRGNRAIGPRVQALVNWLSRKRL